MGDVAVVEGVVVVVVGPGEIALVHQLAADGVEGFLVGVGDHLTVHGQPRQVHQLAAAGAAGPGGLIVVGELDALGGQTVQRGGQLRVDDRIVEGLGGDEDQILSRKQAGVVVLRGGLEGGQVLIQGLELEVGFLLGQGLKVQPGNDMGGIDLFRFPGGEGLPTGSFRGLRKGLYDRKLQDDGIGLIAQAGKLRVHGGGDAPLPDAGVEIVGIEPACDAAGHSGKARKAHSRAHQRTGSGGKEEAGASDRHLFLARQDCKHHGNQCKGNAAQVVQDHLNDHIGVVGEDAPGACDNAAGAHVGAVGVAHHVLHQHNEGAQEGKDGGKHLGPLPGKQRGNQAQKSADAQGKAQKLRQHRRGDRAAHPQVEH